MTSETKRQWEIILALLVVRCASKVFEMGSLSESDSDWETLSIAADITDESDNSLEIIESESETDNSECNEPQNTSQNNQNTRNYIAKNGMEWSSTPRCVRNHSRSENILRLRPGITQYASSRIYSIKSSFDLLMSTTICAKIVRHTNAYGAKNISRWTDINVDTLHAYFAILILAGVYK